MVLKVGARIWNPHTWSSRLRAPHEADGSGIRCSRKHPRITITEGRI